VQGPAAGSEQPGGSGVHAGASTVSPLLAISWIEALDPWHIAVAVGVATIAGFAGTLYVRQHARSAAKPRREIHSKGKKSKKGKRAPDPRPPSEAAGKELVMTAGCSGASSSSGGHSTPADVEVEEDGSDDADGEWQVVQERSPRGAKGRRRGSAPQLPQPLPRPVEIFMPRASRSGGCVKPPASRATQNAPAAAAPTVGAFDDVQLAMALSQSLLEARDPALDDSSSPRGGSIAREPSVHLDAPEPAAQTYAARAQRGLFARRGDGPTSSAAGSAALGGGRRRVGSLPAGRANVGIGMDSELSQRVPAELASLDDAERRAMMDELFRDKALGKRVDRPCDRLREGMARVEAGALSHAAFNAALIEVAGIDKVERAVHHVRSLSDASSDAPTIRATATPRTTPPR